uniref:C2 domain-containing protein n=1 Tax=Palpitomonas bilix TaxID=652834 RepID=A0A7S3CX03_9EUKA
MAGDDSKPLLDGEGGEGEGGEGAKERGEGEGEGKKTEEGAAEEEEELDDSDLEEDEEWEKGRLQFDNELEDTEEYGSLPFDEYSVLRGTKKGRGPFARPPDQVGKFKGFVRVIDNRPGAVAPPPPPFDLTKMKSANEYVARIYVIDAHHLFPADDNGSADPYLVLKLGRGRKKRVIKDRDNYFKTTLFPEFRAVYDINCKLPGESQLRIEVWDYDKVSADDLIGTTVIDLENYLFSKRWNKWSDTLKPLETRTLHHPSTTTAQGKVRLWVEIIPKRKIASVPIINIKKPPPEPFQMRIVVWSARNMVSMDKVTKMNDLYITGIFEAIPPGSNGTITIKQETDIHWRAKKGKGSFNWRMLYDFELPLKQPRIKFQAFDQDITFSSDQIGEANIPIGRPLKKALRKYKKGVKGVAGIVRYPPNKRSLFQMSAKNVLEKIKNKFRGQTTRNAEWIPIRHPNREGKQGEVQVEIEVMHKTTADMRPVGKGRDPPNQYPELPEPDRVKFNLLRPDLMLKELLGESICRKLKCLLVICVLGGCCFFLFPMIITQVLTSIGK